MKLYTKQGDRGETALYGGRRVSKSSARIEAYGTVDELNCVLGLALAEGAQGRTGEVAAELQDLLFVLGGDLATPTDGSGSSAIARMEPAHVERLEQWIDELDAAVPALRNFILPGGCRAGATLHLARTVCRRAERAAVASGEAGDAVNPEAVRFLNRLSDLLFALARFENHRQGVEETVWRAR